MGAARLMDDPWFVFGMITLALLAAIIVEWFLTR